MKAYGAGMCTASVILALGASLLAMSAVFGGPRAGGIARVGWLEVRSPGPKRPHFEIFRAHLAELGYVEGENLLSSNVSRIAGTIGSPERQRSLCGLRSMLSS